MEICLDHSITLPNGSEIRTAGLDDKERTIALGKDTATITSTKAAAIPRTC